MSMDKLSTYFNNTKLINVSLIFMVIPSKFKLMGTKIFTIGLMLAINLGTS